MIVKIRRDYINVWTHEHVIGEWRSYSLCWTCSKLRFLACDNCKPAQFVFDLRRRCNVIIAIWECPRFTPRSNPGIITREEIMSEMETYEHHGKTVYVMSGLKGRHREYCLCWKCASFTPDNVQTNCPIAHELYELCCTYHLTTPVWECPNFKEKAAQ